MNKARVEQITDGIIAIAATIMVLQMKLPSVNGWEGLAENWHVFLAYVISFLLIWIAWAMHHDLFQKASILSKRTYMINGIWTLALTLIPFTTAWIGSAPDAFLPAFLYPLNLLMWSAAFQWLSHQMQKDNPDSAGGGFSKSPAKALIYMIYALCMILAFIKPILSIFLTGASTVARFAGMYSAGTRKQ